MGFRLINQNDPDKTLSLTVETWYGILELAEDYGWTPFGTVQPGWWSVLDMRDEWQGSYFTGDGRLVVFEDALNLADALEVAFLAYDPVRSPSLVDLSLYSSLFSPAAVMPSIGAILGVANFCRFGEFLIEKF